MARRGKQCGRYTDAANASVRLEQEFYDALADMAEQEDISIATILRRGAKEQLAKYQEQQQHVAA